MSNIFKMSDAIKELQLIVDNDKDYEVDRIIMTKGEVKVVMKGLII